LVFILACANTALGADDMKMPTNSGDDFKWGPAPPVLPKGAEIAVLSGDPSKDAPYVISSPHQKMVLLKDSSRRISKWSGLDVNRRAV
jgi:hypothetical protein